MAASFGQQIEFPGDGPEGIVAIVEVDIAVVAALAVPDFDKAGFGGFGACCGASPQEVVEQTAQAQSAACFVVVGSVLHSGCSSAVVLIGTCRARFQMTVRLE